MTYHNAVAEQVFGTIGTICWTIQLVPQVWKSYRSKDTTGLSHWLVLIWAIASIFLGVYVVVQKLNIPLMVQPQSFGFLAFICWGQCQYYGAKRSLKMTIFLTVTGMIMSGILEFVLVLAVQAAHGRPRERATQFFGIFASILVAAGLFPQYWEIYKHREVIGLSMIFMAVDFMGGVFSVLSLVFKEDFDVIAAITYASVIVLDGIVILAALILNPMARRRRRRHAEERALEASRKEEAAFRGQSETPTSISSTT
ncbi:hypothetical protein CVT26_008048 [Gymnopilus dilepis]|uniref:Uncharacterized protein n=1 Tax=Gymnopilus dilepis TaxID=231916 RepID=A0A409YJM4_9AGAR|nr:hypothetical protein CVT26_008048 [Gymnopilus dilepis]